MSERDWVVVDSQMSTRRVKFPSSARPSALCETQDTFMRTELTARVIASRCVLRRGSPLGAELNRVCHHQNRGRCKQSPCDRLPVLLAQQRPGHGFREGREVVLSCPDRVKEAKLQQGPLQKLRGRSQLCPKCSFWPPPVTAQCCS